MTSREKNAKIMAIVALLAIVWSIVWTGLTVVMSSPRENNPSSENGQKLPSEKIFTASWDTTTASWVETK
jgi:hypothetical protein